MDVVAYLPADEQAAEPVQQRDRRGGQRGTRSGNSARSRLDQLVDLLGHRIVPASGVEQVQPAVGVGLNDLVADGRVGTAFQEQADHLDMTVRDRPVQAGPSGKGTRNGRYDAVVPV